MAKIHLDRIKEKFGWSGKNYQDLVTNILTQNRKNIKNNVGRILVRDFRSQASKLEEGKTVQILDLQDVFPKRSVYMLKAAEQGELITDTLRDKLTRRLRQVLSQPEYAQRRGRNAGLIKENLVSDFQGHVTEIFDGYTKKTKKEMPTNISTIAKTEVHSAINMVRHEYISALTDKNPDLQMMKVWIHRGSRRKDYAARVGHRNLNLIRVPFREDFRLEGIRGQTYSVSRPHDDRLPAEESINCGCEIKYVLAGKTANTQESGQ